MMKPAIAAIAASTLLLAGCSSAPTDEQFCAALQEWTLLTSDMATAQQDFANTVDYGTDDFPTPEEVHSFGRQMVGIVSQADGAMAEVVASTSDPEVATSLQTAHDGIAGLFGGMGEAALAAEDYLDYLDNLGNLEDFTIDLDESDSDAVDEYVYSRCEDADSWGEDG